MEVLMTTPVRIVFRDIPPSEPVRQLVEEKLEKLARSHRIIGGEVALEAPHRAHHQGTHYRVRIDLQVPGAELVYGRNPGDEGIYEDLYLAVRDAFDAMERIAAKHEQRRRGQVKTHRDPQADKMDQDVRFPNKLSRT
jgi:ribosome-associated translation inhibitor RaiA